MTDHAPEGPTSPASTRTIERSDGSATDMSATGLGVAHLAPDGTFHAVNEVFTAVSGYSRSDLEGRSVTAVLPNELRSTDALLEAHRAGRSGPPIADLPIETATGEVVAATSAFQCLDGTEDGADGVVWLLRAHSPTPPVSPTGNEGESAVGKSFLALADAVPDGIIVLDSNSDIQYANPAVERILGYAPAELVGGSKLKIIPERFQRTHLNALERYLETGERSIDWSYVELSGRHEAGHEVPLGVSLNTFTYGGDRYFVGLFRDVTPQKRAQQALATRLAQQETAARLGRRALRADAIDGLLDEAVEAVAAGLDAEYAKVLELSEDGRELLLRSGVGWEPGLVGSATISATADDSQAGHTLSESHPIVVEDLGSETRFSGPPLLTDHDVRSGVSVTIGPTDDLWGILGVHDTRRREFTEHDVHFVESAAHVLATAIDRNRHAEQLERQREQLLALDRLNALIHGIHQAIIRETSQSEIERSVCEGLIEKDIYRFAAIWHADPASGRVSPATHAGRGAGYPDHATAATPVDEGPIVRALEEREPCVVPEIAGAEPAAPWREEALARGYRSVAAISIVYENVLFGVLGVYSDVEGAFGETVRTVLEILGKTIGHAIATANQERTLLSREKTALTLGIGGFNDVMGIAVDEEGSFEVSSLVPRRRPLSALRRGRAGDRGAARGAGGLADRGHRGRDGGRRRRPVPVRADARGPAGDSTNTRTRRPVARDGLSGPGPDNDGRAPADRERSAAHRGDRGDPSRPERLAAQAPDPIRVVDLLDGRVRGAHRAATRGTGDGVPQRLLRVATGERRGRRRVEARDLLGDVSAALPDGAAKAAVEPARRAVRRWATESIERVVVGNSVSPHGVDRAPTRPSRRRRRRAPASGPCSDRGSASAARTASAARGSDRSIPRG